MTKVGQCHPKLPLVQRLYWAYQAAKYEIYTKRTDASGDRNVAAFCEVPEIRGDFAVLDLENGKSYTKRPRGANIIVLQL